MNDILRMIEEGRYHMIATDEMEAVESKPPVELRPRRRNDKQAA